MSSQEMEVFPPGVVDKLKTYVYRLIDPRNGETFYVGKGTGNRVFAHVRAEQSLEDDELSNKLQRIREIRMAGFEVAHVIHRHGMDAKTAFEVEAALYAWKLKKSKAEKAQVVLATRQGLIVGAFIADTWLEATAANSPGHEDVDGRIGFIGREAPTEIKESYVGKRVPDEYRKPGAANPVKYTW